jgi:hypothetical protein
MPARDAKHQHAGPLHALQQNSHPGSEHKPCLKHTLRSTSRQQRPACPSVLRALLLGSPCPHHHVVASAGGGVCAHVPRGAVSAGLPRCSSQAGSGQGGCHTLANVPYDMLKTVPAVAASSSACTAAACPAPVDAPACVCVVKCSAYTWHLTHGTELTAPKPTAHQLIASGQGRAAGADVLVRCGDSQAGRGLPG